MSNSTIASSSNGQECILVDDDKATLADLWQCLRALQSTVDQLRAENAKLQKDHEKLQRNFQTLKNEITGTHNTVHNVKGLVSTEDIHEMKNTAAIMQEEISQINFNLREWKIGQKPPEIEGDIEESRLSRNTALVKHNGVIQLFTTSPSTASYLLRARYTGERFYEWRSINLVPNTTHVIFIPEYGKVVIFDLLTSRLVREFAFERGVKKCYASENEFLVCLENKEIVVGRLNEDGGYTVIGTCDDETHPRISPNGVVAFVEDGRLRLFYAKRSETICEVEVNSTVNRIRLNEDGSLVALYERNIERLHLFDVARRSQRYICTIGEPYCHGLHKNCFSDCGRYLAVTSFDRILIFELDHQEEAAEGGAWTRHFVHTMGEDDSAQAFRFRNIDDVDHFQYVNHRGLLKLCKRDEETKSWNMIE